MVINTGRPTFVARFLLRATSHLPRWLCFYSTPDTLTAGGFGLAFRFPWSKPKGRVIPIRGVIVTGIL